MKKQIVIIFLFGFQFFACKNSIRNNNHPITTDSIPSALSGDTKPLDKTTEVVAKQDKNDKSLEDWVRSQDSIRNVILSNKENEVLKNSILQEAYIKNIVWLKNDTLFFSIPFNLHGFDCLAPDCYSTDLTFNFKFKDSFHFPNKLPFNIHEYGCVKKEINSSGIFQLIETDKNFITYHSPSNKSTLVILKNDERKEFIYYFVDVNSKTIKGNLIHKIIDAYDEENSKSIVPYRSTIMASSEYELFIDKKVFN